MSVPVAPPAVLRDHVADVLAATLGASYARVEGRVFGPAKNRPLFCTWPIGRFPVDGNVLEEDMRIGASIYLIWKQDVSADRPFDPAELEQLSEAVLLALSSAQTDEQDFWFLHVEALDFDLPAQGMHLTIRGRRWNSFGC